MSAAILSDVVKFSTMYAPSALNTTGTLYNDGGTTGSGLDTQGFDEVAIGVLVGTVTHPNLHHVTIVESDTDNASAGNTVTGSGFTGISSATTGTQRLGYLRCANTKRYLWAKIVTTGGVTGTPIGVAAALYKADAGPAGSTFDFEKIP